MAATGDEQRALAEALAWRAPPRWLGRLGDTGWRRDSGYAFLKSFLEVYLVRLNLHSMKKHSSGRPAEVFLPGPARCRSTFQIVHASSLAVARSKNSDPKPW